MQLNRLFRLLLLAFVLCSVFVTALAFFSADRTFAVQGTPTAMTKNPLRLIAARFPRYEVLYRNPEQESLVGWVDTLECGHQIQLYNLGVAGPDFGLEAGQKRHRCAQCAAAQAVPKKPVQSLSSAGSSEKAKAAAA